MKMIKKIKTLTVLTVFIIGTSVAVVGVLPMSAEGAPYRGVKFTADNLSSSVSGLKHKFPFIDKADTLLLNRLEGNVPARTVYFHHDTNSGNWYPTLARGPFNASMDLNFGAKGYFWYRYSDNAYHYYKSRPITQRFLKFEVQNDMSPIPIPGAALLLASGLLGLGWLNQRRSKALRG